LLATIIDHDTDNKQIIDKLKFLINLLKGLTGQMSISFVTWNINKSSYADISIYLTDILKKHSPDTLTFFESENLVETDIEKLGYSKIKLTSLEPSKKVIKMFLKDKSNYEINNKYNFTELVVNELKSLTLSPQVKDYLVEESKIIRRIEKTATLEAFEIKNTKTKERFLYVALHIPSKINYDEYDQFQLAMNYKKYITNRAEEYGNKVLVAGDFNMAPFERGMTEPMGFFAFQNNNEVNPAIEHILGNRQLSFYNPCWRLLGDYDTASKSFRAGGSFFYEKSRKRKAKTWHLFDQIIMTKNLFNFFDNDSLSLFETTILSNDVKDPKKTIDHLPLCFTLKL